MKLSFPRFPVVNSTELVGGDMFDIVTGKDLGLYTSLGTTGATNYQVIIISFGSLVWSVMYIYLQTWVEA